MKDKRIRYRPSERRALVDHEVVAFRLISGNQRAQQTAELYLSSIEAITAACRQQGPFLYAVSTRGLGPLDLT